MVRSQNAAWLLPARSLTNYRMNTGYKRTVAGMPPFFCIQDRVGAYWNCAITYGHMGDTPNLNNARKAAVFYSCKVG